MKLTVVSSLLLIGAAAYADAQNLSFELEASGAPGLPATWLLPDDTNHIRLDRDLAQHGAQSLLIEATRGGTARFSQRYDVGSNTAERIRISAFVRRNTSTPTPTLWVRVTRGGRFLYVDRVSPATPVGLWTRVVLDVPPIRPGDQLSFGGLATGDGSVWFDNFAFDEIDTADLPAPSATAERYLNYALGLISEHALARRTVDWAEFRRRVHAQLRGATSTEDAHLAVRYALMLLDDGHSYFLRAQQMSRLEGETVSNARTGRPSVAPSAAWAGERLAWLTVPGFAGGDPMSQREFGAELQGLIRDYDAGGACAWIVDLRGNRGGNLWPMLTGAGPLLIEGAVATTVYPDGRDEDIWYRDGKAGLGDYVRLRVHEPYRLDSESPPLAVLVDGSTASAAEILAVALTTSRSAMSFGTPTRGALTATRVLPLSDGAAINLAVAATRDIEGRLLDDVLVPDVVVEPGTRASRGGPGSDPVLTRATAWLSTQSACRA